MHPKKNLTLSRHLRNFSKMKYFYLTLTLLLVSTLCFSANRYWVGGTGTWDSTNTSHWSDTSGGLGGFSVPTSIDVVVFDSNSGNGVVSLANINTGYAKSLNFTKYTGTFSGTVGLWLYGNLTIGPNTNWLYTGGISVLGNCNITTNGKTILGLLGLRSLSTLTLMDNLSCANTLEVQNGTFNANNKNITIQRFVHANTNNSGTVYMGSGLWTITGSGTIWDCTLGYPSLPTHTATIKLTDSSGLGTIFMAGFRTYYNFWVATSGTGEDKVFGNTSINNIKIEPGRTLVFVSGATININTLTANGTPANPIVIKSTNTSPHILSKASGVINVNYCNISNSTVSGGATWNAINCSNLGNNSGWIFSNLSPVAPWSTYLGGYSSEYSRAVAIDKLGNIYCSGTTFSTGMATPGAYQTTLNGGYDAYLAKFNSSGVLQWATYLGGPMVENGGGIAIDKNGDIYWVGNSNSSLYVATFNTYQNNYGGNTDGFIAKFNPYGNLQWCTYYGGSQSDFITGVAIDTAGDIVVSGGTSSTSDIASPGAYQSTYGGGTYDIFIAKFNSSGSRIWGTYFGGNLSDRNQFISTDNSGNIYTGSFTNSTTGVASTGSLQSTFGGGNSDFLITKFNSAGIMQWSTYYGGTGDDECYGIANDSSGNILISGWSGSAGLASGGAFQTTNGGAGDALILKLNSSGAKLWSTYFGGNQLDQANGIFAQANGDFFITGKTGSTSGIATAGAYQSTYMGANDAFLAKFNSNGARIWGTYFGGTGAEFGSGVFLSPLGSIVITGQTQSTSNISTPGAHQTTIAYYNYEDIFITSFSGSGGLPVKYYSFNASMIGDINNPKVECNWVSTMEQNNSHFVVERSTHESEFEAVGIVKGSGNSTVNRSYQFIDNKPYFGTSYYRLKQVDFDGKYEYTNPVKVEINGNEIESTLSIYPNPAKGEINICCFEEPIEFKLSLIDVLGRTYSLPSSYLDNKSLKVKLPDLVSGTYILLIEDPYGKRVLKLIVN